MMDVDGLSEAHRPGPWRLSAYRDGSSIIIIDAEGFDVATVHYPNRDATARLIVSAPGLAKEIDALKAEVAHWRQARNDALKAGDVLKAENERLRIEIEALDALSNRLLSARGGE